jgi:hypothetical protein
MQTLYRSPNGDTWFLARDPETGAAFVRHQANAASGAQVTDLPIEQFLSGPESPERDALLRVIGASILNPREAEADEPTGREWSDPEMTGLGEMLVRGVSIEEIAVRLRRDKVEVRDKVAEVGRACRWGAILRGGQTEEGSQPRAGTLLSVAQLFNLGETDFLPQAYVVVQAIAKAAILLRTIFSCY